MQPNLHSGNRIPFVFQNAIGRQVLETMFKGMREHDAFTTTVNSWKSFHLKFEQEQQNAPSFDFQPIEKVSTGRTLRKNNYTYVYARVIK